MVKVATNILLKLGSKSKLYNVLENELPNAVRMLLDDCQGSKEEMDILVSAYSDLSTRIEELHQYQRSKLEQLKKNKRKSDLRILDSVATKGRASKRLKRLASSYDEEDEDDSNRQITYLPKRNVNGDDFDEDYEEDDEDDQEDEDLRNYDDFNEYDDEEYEEEDYDEGEDDYDEEDVDGLDVLDNEYIEDDEGEGEEIVKSLGRVALSVSLGKSVRVTVQLYDLKQRTKPLILIHIKEYYKLNDGVLRPSRYGITLTKKEYREFQSRIQNLKDITTKNARFQYTLGSRTAASKILKVRYDNKGIRELIIREELSNAGHKPDQDKSTACREVYLQKSHFDRLIRYADDIEATIEEHES